MAFALDCTFTQLFVITTNNNDNCYLLQVCASRVYPQISPHFYLISNQTEIVPNVQLF